MSSAVQLAAKALRSALLFGGVASLGIALVGGAIGYSLVGSAGIWSALVGSAVAFVFMGVTAGSILVGQKASGGSRTRPETRPEGDAATPACPPEAATAVAAARGGA